MEELGDAPVEGDADKAQKEMADQDPEPISALSAHQNAQRGGAIADGYPAHPAQSRSADVDQGDVERQAAQNDGGDLMDGPYVHGRRRTGVRNRMGNGNLLSARSGGHWFTVGVNSEGSGYLLTVEG